MYPAKFKTSDFVGEVLLLAGSIFVYTPLVVNACDFYTAGGVTVDTWLGGSVAKSTNGLSVIAGLPPWVVLACYVAISALIVVDLFVGARALIHLKILGELSVKELREEKL